MGINIVIDDELMQEALALTGLKTEQEVIELGLKTLIRIRKQEKLKNYKGKLQWKVDLEDSKHRQ